MQSTLLVELASEMRQFVSDLTEAIPKAHRLRSVYACLPSGPDKGDEDRDGYDSTDTHNTILTP